MREATLRSASGASRAVLQDLLRKKWIAREDLSEVRDASRSMQIATLKEVEGKLNANQQTIVDYLRQQPEQRAPVSALREIGGSANHVADPGAPRHRRDEQRSRRAFACRA